MHVLLGEQRFCRYRHAERWAPEFHGPKGCRGRMAARGLPLWDWMLKTELGWMSARIGTAVSVDDGFRWQPGGGDPALNRTAM